MDGAMTLTAWDFFLGVFPQPMVFSLLCLSESYSCCREWFLC